MGAAPGATDTLGAAGVLDVPGVLDAPDVLDVPAAPEAMGVAPDALDVLSASDELDVMDEPGASPAALDAPDAPALADALPVSGVLSSCEPPETSRPSRMLPSSRTFVRIAGCPWREPRRIGSKS